jgi:hypothetical protein
MALVLLGNAGVVTVVVSLLLSFSNVDGSTDALTRMLFLVGGLTLVWLIARSKLANRALSRMIERALRRFTDLDTRDYVGLLRLSGDWVVAELEVQQDDWMCDVPLQFLGLPEEGIVVLGIDRTNKNWIGAPSGGTTMHPGDIAVLYGTKDAIDRLDQRERSPQGEIDRLTSQVEFTEQYLAQQRLEAETEVPASAPPDPTLRLSLVDEAPGQPNQPGEEHQPGQQHQPG